VCTRDGHVRLDPSAKTGAFDDKRRHATGVAVASEELRERARLLVEQLDQARLGAPPDTLAEALQAWREQLRALGRDLAEAGAPQGLELQALASEEVSAGAIAFARALLCELAER